MQKSLQMKKSLQLWVPKGCILLDAFTVKIDIENRDAKSLCLTIGPENLRQLFNQSDAKVPLVNCPELLYCIYLFTFTIEMQEENSSWCSCVYILNPLTPRGD